MRMLPAPGADNVYEVHENNRMIGRVWAYDSVWRAEMKDGTRVGDEYDDAKSAANAVAREHRR